MTMDVCNLTDSHDVKPEILCALFVKLSFCKLNLSKTEVNSMQNIWKTDILSSLVKANYFKHFWTWVKFGAIMTMDLCNPTDSHSVRLAYRQPPNSK